MIGTVNRFAIRLDFPTPVSPTHISVSGCGLLSINREYCLSSPFRRFNSRATM
jgi:hypothetical protein